jgi:hypothetical protein
MESETSKIAGLLMKRIQSFIGRCGVEAEGHFLRYRGRQENLPYLHPANEKGVTLGSQKLKDNSL